MNIAMHIITILRDDRRVSHLELKDRSQFEKAKLEDILVDILYRKYRNLVFHGGTCIWRCHSGNRSSRDIDLYYKVEKEEQKVLFLAKHDQVPQGSWFRG
jgi:predicted nucleotidyltransferase component of viral defense system